MTAYAQDYKLEVESFMLEENSLTAINKPVYDNNNQKCALVIITGMGNEKLRFNAGNSFIKVEEKKVNNKRSYLMWISEGVIKLNISSDSRAFNPVDYFFNPRVKKAETYLMELKISATESLIDKQYLEFHIVPSSAYIEVNGEPWKIRDGIAYKQLPKGQYSYTIQANDYHTEAGLVDFSNTQTKKIIEVELKPNFGWLTITTPTGIDNLTILIDDKIITSDLSKIQLSSGKHKLKISKEMYLPLIQDILIKDNEELNITPQLVPNYSTITFIAEGNASIYLDDKLLGYGYWSGDLSIGNYIIKIKKENYKTYSQTISIAKAGESNTYKFQELAPILGAVNIESNPPGAQVKIDGIDYGKTPIYVPKIITGSHVLSIHSLDYSTYTQTFIIEDGKQLNLSCTLKTGNSTKYAIIDINRIIQVMPEYATFSQQINKKTQQFENELHDLEEKYAKQLDAYNNAPTRRKANRLQNLEAKINQYKKEKKSELENFQQEEMRKLESIVTSIVHEVSHKQGFEIVLQKERVLYYGEDVLDATDLIINAINN